MTKLVILIIDDDESGDIFYAFAKKVWRQNLREKDIPYYFLNGTQSDVSDENVTVSADSLLSRFYEDFSHRITQKTYSGIKYCLENISFDFLLRTNLSSFYDLVNLQRYLESLESKNIYAGKITRQYYYDTDGRQKEFSFCSGSGFVMSRDVCEKVMQRHQLISKNQSDDIWIRLVLQDIPMLDIKRCDLIKIGLYCNETLALVDQYIHQSTKSDIFHFRVKECFNDLPRSIGDAIAMETLRKSF